MTSNFLTLFWDPLKYTYQCSKTSFVEFQLDHYYPEWGWRMGGTKIWLTPFKFSWICRYELSLATSLVAFSLSQNGNWIKIGHRNLNFQEGNTENITYDKGGPSLPPAWSKNIFWDWGGRLGKVSIVNKHFPTVMENSIK